MYQAVARCKRCASSFLRILMAVSSSIGRPVAIVSGLASRSIYSSCSKAVSIWCHNEPTDTANTALPLCNSSSICSLVCLLYTSTTPIKALSNQKYHDLVDVYGPDKVGLLTGDTSINSEADIVVMTTEVLRNMLYERSTTLNALRYVILDEVHYLADRFRGPVWEEDVYKRQMHNHPYVSEAHEGKPWFEWCVLGVVAVITLLVAFGYTMAATVILAVTAIITGLVRLILQDRSPWKVRSVAFDSFIGIALGIGLLITYFSFFGLFGNIFFR